MKFALECDMVRERNSERKFSLDLIFSLVRAAGPSPFTRIRPSTHNATDDEKVDNIKPQIKCNCKKIYTTRNWWVPHVGGD